MNLNRPIGASVSSMVIYVAKGATDEEGRTPFRTIGRFINLKDAKAAAQGAGVMGIDGPVNSVTVQVVSFIDPFTGESMMFQLHDEPILAVYEDPKAIRATALAKLTAKEKKALGL